MTRRLLVLAFSLLGSLLATDSRGTPFAYVSQADGNVAVIELEPGRASTIVAVGVGGTPGPVAVLPGERYAYVPDAARSRISLLDSLPQAVVALISVPTPLGIAFNPTMPRAYVVSGAGNDPTLIRTDTNVAMGTIAGLTGAARVEVNPTGTRAYFTSPSSGAVRVTETAGNTLFATIPTGAAGLSGMALHPAQNRLFVGDTGSTVYVIDLGSNTVVATIPTGAGPDNLTFNASGSRLYIANSAASSVTVVDSEGTGTNVLATIPLSGVPSGIQADPVGGTIHVPVTASGTQGKVDLIDANTTVVARTLSLGAPVSAAATHFIGGAVPLVTDTPSILTGLWWNPAERGWGMHLTHRRDLVFLAWFTYDAAGSPRWYVVSSCRMSAPLICPTCVSNTRCSGDVFDVSGPRFFNAPFDPNAVRTLPTGVAQVDFADKDHATVTYTLVNRLGKVSIERNVFAAPVGLFLSDFSDLWWNATEPGWGLAITHQSGTMFLAWFVYDDSGRPTWYFASSCAVNATNNGCSGTLYRTAGPPGPSVASAFNPAQVTVSAVGTVSVSFTTYTTANLTYTVNGVQGFKTISRRLF